MFLEVSPVHYNRFMYWIVSQCQGSNLVLSGFAVVLNCLGFCGKELWEPYSWRKVETKEGQGGGGGEREVARSRQESLTAEEVPETVY